MKETMKIYEAPELKIAMFEAQDIVTLSEPQDIDNFGNYGLFA